MELLLRILSGQYYDAVKAKGHSEATKYWNTLTDVLIVRGNTRANPQTLYKIIVLRVVLLHCARILHNMGVRLM